MPLIRVTQKLQKEIEIKPADLAAVPQKRVPFEEWYAHVFVLDRKKQLIFVETQTLFSFSVENVTRKDIRERLSELFEKGLGRALYIEEANSEVISKVIGVCRREFAFAKTESRKTIGAMNEFIKQHQFGFFYQCRPLDVRDRWNRYMPVRGFPDGSKKHEFPIDVFAKALKEQFGLGFTPHKEDYLEKIFAEGRIRMIEESM